MGVSAFVAPWALLPFCNKLAHVLRVKVAITFAIFGVMIVYTVLMDMLLRVGTRVEFEVVNIQILIIKAYLL